MKWIAVYRSGVNKPIEKSTKQTPEEEEEEREGGVESRMPGSCRACEKEDSNVRNMVKGSVESTADVAIAL